jgi:hypothetical protein
MRPAISRYVARPSALMMTRFGARRPTVFERKIWDRTL